MIDESSAIYKRRAALPPGVVWGALGVLSFSGSLPATRVAVRSLDPVIVGLGRAVVAGGLAIVVLRVRRVARPTAGQWRRLGVVALGVVFGFPLLTAFALQRVPAAHGSVVIGMLPAATAVLAVRRTGQRPGAMFWAAALIGSLIVVAFALRHGTSGLERADVLLLGAVALAAFAYAEGGLLAQEMPGSEVICWALVLAFPFTIALTGVVAVRSGLHAPATGWLGFAYLSGISMFLGFFAWYRGLAEGGVARISQMQLVQPALSLVWARLFLGERLEPIAIVTVLAVIACVAVAQRARITGAQPKRIGNTSGPQIPVS